MRKQGGEGGEGGMEGGMEGWRERGRDGGRERGGREGDPTSRGSLSSLCFLTATAASCAKDRATTGSTC